MNYIQSNLIVSKHNEMTTLVQMTRILQLSGIHYANNYQYYKLSTFNLQLSKEHDCISGVMVSMLTSSALECGFKPRSGHTKEHWYQGVRVKASWLRIRIMCSSGTKCLHSDDVSVSYHYKNSTEECSSSMKQIFISSHRM